MCLDECRFEMGVIILVSVNPEDSSICRRSHPISMCSNARQHDRDSRLAAKSNHLPFSFSCEVQDRSDRTSA